VKPHFHSRASQKRTGLGSVLGLVGSGHVTTISIFNSCVADADTSAYCIYDISVSCSSNKACARSKGETPLHNDYTSFSPMSWLPLSSLALLRPGVSDYGFQRGNVG
jgi:hypothetical protein